MAEPDYVEEVLPLDDADLALLDSDRSLTAEQILRLDSELQRRARQLRRARWRWQREHRTIIEPQPPTLPY